VQNIVYVAKHFIVETTWFPDEVDLIHAIMVPNVFFLNFNPSIFFSNGFLNQFVTIAWKHTEVLLNRLGLVHGLLNLFRFHGAVATSRVS